MSKYLRCVGTDRDSVTGKYTFPDDPLSPFVKTEDAYRFLDEADKRIAQLEARNKELLEALEELLSRWRLTFQDPECKDAYIYDIGWYHAQAKAQAAIAKAKGDVS